MNLFKKTRVGSHRHVAFPLGLVGLILFVQPLPIRGADLSGLIPRLEKALNTSGETSLKTLLGQKYGSKQVSRYIKFMDSFPNAIWSVKKASPLKDGSPTLEISVTGRKRTVSHNFLLEARQILVLQTEGGQIIGHELISEQSILRSSKKPLPITLHIPDTVLTGSRYDVDVVFDDPLGDAMVAAGLIALTPDQLAKEVSPAIELFPMGGGGLFKSVKAPLNPGIQTWVALLAHSDGLISITKSVRVVSDENNLTP